MTSPPDSLPEPSMAPKPGTPPRPGFRESLAVYLQPRVLIVLLLGFSAGLPFSLAGQTLQAWMTESGVNIKTIGLFSAVGVPYLAKPFLVEELKEAVRHALAAEPKAEQSIGGAERSQAVAREK